MVTAKLMSGYKFVAATSYFLNSQQSLSYSEISSTLRENRRVITVFTRAIQMALS
jgi:hypothetical protein